MEEEMLLGNVSGTLFPDRDRTQISDLTETNLFAPIALDDEEPEFGLSASELDRLAAFRSASAIDSDSDLAKLIDDAIAENTPSNSNSQVPNQSNGRSETTAEDDSTMAEFNAMPEESAGRTDDAEDGSGSVRQTLEGTDDDDLIVGTSADEVIFGKKGRDRMRGNGGKDRLYGGKDDDDCDGGDGDDEIRGDRGNDICDGGQGDDKVYGGKDNDTILGGSDQDTCFGDDGDDWVNGNDGNDEVDGGAGSDSVYGGKGDDKCDGGEGNDTVRGDRGNDIVNGGEGNDIVNGGKDNDTVMGGAGSDVCDGDDGDDSVMGGTGNDTVMGGAGNDACDGGDGDDSVMGGDGGDTLMGGAGNDVCDGGDGDDSVMGGDGGDTLMGGAGNDACDGGDGDDSVMGGDGGDTLMGGAGNDACDGGDGDDSVMGGDGGDTLMGGAGNDVCDGGDGDDSVVAGTGDDTLMGGAGNDTLMTGDGNDMADGGDGDDSVVGGGNGNDTLMGNNGNDTIVGGTGNHTCIGGAGNDVFVMSNTTSPGSSVITDYTDGSDRFLLFGDLIFSSLSFVQVGINTEIRGSNSFVLALLLNVSATILDASDFLGANGTPVAPTPTPTPTRIPTLPVVNAPPRSEANKSLTVGSDGNQITITSDFLKFVDSETNASGTVFKVTQLPDATTGQLFFKGVAVTQVGLSFTQADISLGLLTFQAAIGFVGAASFGFEVSDGKNVLANQTFSLKVEQNVFNFAGNTAPQVIVGSATLNNNIQGSDGSDDITSGSGNDKIIGGQGKDKIKGGDGDNDIDGGDDDDDIEVGKGKNKIKGGLGKDKIKGGDGDNDIDGGDDDDDIEVGKGKNKIKGGLGNDKIKGGDDDDEIDGGVGTNTLTGGAGKDRFIYLVSRQEIQTVVEADLITDFNVNDDVLELSTAAFGNLSVSSLTRLAITANSAVGSIGSANLLDFSADISVTSIATLQARFAALGGNTDAPVFCQFTDATTGRSVLVFSVGARFEIVTSFSLTFSLQVSNFVFSGPSLNVPVGTAGADNVNFGTYPAAVNFDGLGGDDNIVGSNFNDTIKGGDGNDTITGGLGLDVLSGGSGADLFVYATTKEGGDKITDFTFGVDKFQFAASEFGNLTTTNFDGVTGSTPDITGKELVIFTGGSYASLEAAQASAIGSSTSAGFFAFTNASNETVLYFDSNGTVTGGSTLIANLGTATGSLGSADFLFTGSISNSPTGTTTNSGSVADLTAAGNTFPVAFNNFGSGAGGYNFSTPVLFTGDATANSVTGTEFADIITGGGGADILTGGSGADIFGYKAPGDGADTITDFTFGVDKFQFAASEFGNLTTTNFDGVTGSTPDITGKELVIFTGGSYASLEAAQASAIGSSTSAGFFAFTNASNETVLYFDSNGTLAGGSTLIANLGTAAGSLGSADFLFTGSISNSPIGTTTNSGSVADLTAAGNTFPVAFNNFGSGAGGYNFSTPVLFTGDATANSVTGTEFADIITGGGGADILTGGSGADIFGYKAPGDGADTITDFTFGVDKFQFAASEFGNLTTTNFDGVTGSTPDITGKELVIFTGGSYASLEAAQASAIGSSTSAGFFAFTNASNETVLYFDSNGTLAGGSTLIANLGTAAGSLGSADFLFTGSISNSPIGTTTNSGSVADLTAAGNTFPVAFNNFGSGAGGYNFSTPVLFTGDATANSVTGTEFADIITGGGGADILTGGSGADIFGYKAPGDGADTITDFTFGVDKFQFAASEFGNLTTTNFDGVTGSTPDITGKELVIFTGGTYATVEAAQASALGSSTSAGFFAYSNASNETVLVFDSNGTVTGGSTIIANLGTAAGNLGTADFVFTGTITSAPVATSPSSSGSVADLTAAGNTFPVAFNNFGSGAGGYNFSTPVLFTGDASGNNVTGTEFSDILNGGSGADIFDGGAGDDSISGGAGNDSLFGGAGSDTLFGGDGNDTLTGGAGTNVLSGGLGADVFVFAGTTAGGGDIITDYSIVDDVINIDQSAFIGLGAVAGPLGSSFYAYSSTVSVTALEATLTGPSIMAIYDSLSASTKLYYDSNGSTVGGNSLFATVSVDFGVSGNSEVVLF
ncbi:cadherin-like domain-containing protein [Microcoleus sp. S36a_D3]|uniref:cadherin-like domain-containing protein n=1 Tax=Microcoleus sp. S36a_D3 TaxID=3055417 RepID=UPI002FD46979